MIRLAAALLPLWALGLAACGDAPGDPPADGGSAESSGAPGASTDTSASTGGAVTGGVVNPEGTSLQLGHGHLMFEPLTEGGEFPLVMGTQGAWMLPISLRASGFPLPGDPTDIDDPDLPRLDAFIDVEGMNDDALGHFISEIGYPVPFEVLADGTYEYVSVWMIIPDAVAAEDVVGLPCRLETTLYLADGNSLVAGMDLTIAGGPAPG